HLALHVQGGQDGGIFDLLELLLRDALLTEIVTRLQHFGRPEKTADMVGAVVRGHVLLPPRGAIGSASRTVRAARAITSSFANAAARGRYFMPQSGAITG